MKNNKISKNDLIQRIKSLEIELKRRPKKRDSPAIYYNSLKLFGSWNRLMESAGFDVQYYQCIKDIRLDNNLAYFIGLMITDGHIYYNDVTKRYKVAIYTSNAEEKEMIVHLINRMFSYRPAISSRMYGYNKRPNYEIRVSSKVLADLLMREYGIPCGKKSLTVGIPQMILKTDIEIKKSFLRGIIDGDGSILKNSVKIASGSNRFLEGLKELFSSIGVTTGKIIQDNNSNTLSIRISNKKGLLKIKEIYDYGIEYPRKKESIEKFYKFS